MQFLLNIDIIKTEYGFRYPCNQKDCPWTHLVKVLLRIKIEVEFKLEHNQMGSSGFPVRGIIAFVHRKKTIVHLRAES